MLRKIICKFGLIILTIAGITPAYPQIGTFSPYSRFGIGELNDVNSTMSFSMAGTDMASRYKGYINIFNPASYTVFDTLSFVFNGGLFTNSATFKTDDFEEDASYSTISHLLFGFPITDWLSSSFGLLPYSDVGYNIADEQFDEATGLRTRYLYEGSGGFNQVFLGSAIKITPKLSLGFNVKYLFGTIQNSRIITFPDSAMILNTRINDELTADDFFLDYGIQYFTPLSENIDLGLGLSASHQQNLNTRRDHLAYTLFPGPNDIEYVRDTVSLINNEKGDIVLPMGFGFGVSLSNEEKWLIGSDFHWQNWEEYRTFETSDSLKNSWEVSFGGMFTPDENSISSYLNRINYRFGIKYAKTYLEFQNEDINDIGISFGFGLPLRKTKSKLNFGVEFGRKGTTVDGLIQENYIMFSFGVSVFERWFVQRKYY